MRPGLGGKALPQLRSRCESGNLGKRFRAGTLVLLRRAADDYRLQIERARAAL